MSLPWATARTLDEVEDDPTFQLWAATPENKLLYDNLRRLREELRFVDEMCQRAQAEFRESAVEEVVRQLYVLNRVFDLLAMREQDQLDVLCRIAEGMRIPPEMRLDVFAKVLQTLQSVRQ